MAKQSRQSATGKIIAQSNRMTAKSIYVPVKLRSQVPTIKTSSGTRLKPKQ